MGRTTYKISELGVQIECEGLLSALKKEKKLKEMLDKVDTLAQECDEVAKRYDD